MPLEFIRALALIKRCAAEVNRRLGLLEPRLAEAVAAAAREVLEGQLRRPVRRGRLPDRLGHLQQHERSTR
ncbi:MAG: hypothetical protein MZV70_72060 [Desulfobacterales bacterium]|nr:hypothetical protein [Desulfobacterales bacterium]